MEKLVTLNINGEFDKGFVVQAEVRPDAGTINNQILAIAGASGKLPPHIELLEQYRHWQSLYNNTELFWSRLTPKPGVSNASDKDKAFDACRKAAKLLAKTLNSWLQSPDFQPIVNLLLNHLQNSTSTRILLSTENHWLRRLPWCEWNLLDHIPNAEIVLASPKFKQVKSSGNSGKKEKVKILVILGDDAGTDADEKVIHELIPDADFCWLKEPQRRNLDAPLWEKQWDILFFAGHGKTESDGSIGKIKINSQDWLTIDEIKNHLKKAIDNGLKLAIFNACDGLGIAYQLAEGEDLYLPQIIVMREILPIAIAPKFLQHFLKAYTQGLSLSAAIRDSRKRLQIEEKDFPCASWLPVICQNQAHLPLTWNDLRGVESGINWHEDDNDDFFPQVQKQEQTPKSQENRSAALDIFISYAYEDTQLKNELKKQLAILERQNLITIYSYSYKNSSLINKNYENIIKQSSFYQCRIILLLVSPYFLASEFCRYQIDKARELWEQKKALIIPIKLRPVDDKEEWFSRLKPLPSNSKPVTKWENSDDAFLNTIQGIRTAINEYNQDRI